MITVVNELGDILAQFESDAEAERFERAIDLLEKPLPTARRNPNSGATHRIIEKVTPSLRSKGLEEIITRINQAVFGVNEIKLTDKVAAFIDFFFENRSGDLDPNFFFTLAAFNRSEIRTIFGTLHKVHADMESPGRANVSVGNFHDATPILQAMYVAKHLFPLKLSFDMDLDGPSSDYALNMYRVCGADYRNKYPKPTAFNTGRDLYQSTPLQIAHINLAIKLLSISEIAQALSPEVTGQNLAYSNSRLVREIVKPKWEEPLNELFSSELMTQIGISPEMWKFSQSFAGQNYTGWDTIVHVDFSAFEGFYTAIIGLSTILAKSGGAFDEIQSRDLGLSKAVDVISKEAFGSERLKAKAIHELYIARNPEYMELFGVDESYIHWVMPLFTDMWLYEARPSARNPSNAETMLEIVNLISESIDEIADYCAGNPHPLLQPMGDAGLIVDAADLDANSRLILLRQLLGEPVVYRGVGLDHPLTFTIGYIKGTRLRSDLRGFYAILEAAKKLGNKLPEHRKIHEAKGSIVNVYALEKYNPLNLFVGHGQVSSCCIYPGSVGFDCGLDAFRTSTSSQGRIDYHVQTSLMLLAYNRSAEQFVGSNWAWVPSYVNVPEPRGSGDETEEITQNNGAVLSQMVVLDQFELSVWASGSDYGDRKDVDDSIAEFMVLAPTLFSDNPFGYIFAGMSGYTENIVKDVYRKTFADLTYQGLKHYLSPVQNNVAYKGNVYSDISEFKSDVKLLAYPPNKNLEAEYISNNINYYKCAVCKGDCDDPEAVDNWVEVDSTFKDMLIARGKSAEFLNRDRSAFAHEDCTFWCDQCNAARDLDSQISLPRSSDSLCTACAEQCESCGFVYIGDMDADGLVDGGCTQCMRYCDHCEEYVDPSDIVNVAGAYICVDCYEKRDACSACGTKEYEDQDITEIDGRLFCEDCVKTCEDCNDTRAKSETVCGNCDQPFK